MIRTLSAGTHLSRYTAARRFSVGVPYELYISRTRTLKCIPMKFDGLGPQTFNPLHPICINKYMPYLIVYRGYIPGSPYCLHLSYEYDSDLWTGNMFLLIIIFCFILSVNLSLSMNDSKLGESYNIIIWNLIKQSFLRSACVFAGKVDRGLSHKYLWLGLSKPAAVFI